MIKKIFLDTSPKYGDPKITFTISDNEVMFVDVYFYLNFWSIETLLLEFCRDKNRLIYNREYKKHLFIQDKNKICIENSNILGAKNIKSICDYIEKYIKCDGIF